MRNLDLLPITFAIVVAISGTACAMKANVDNSAKKVELPAKIEQAGTQQPIPIPTETAPSNDNVAAETAKPSDVVRRFYAYYLDGMPQPEENRAKFARFLTTAFLRKALATDDFDLFLVAQDFDETFKDNFIVSQALITGSKATVELKLNGETFKWKRKVFLKLEKGEWKIDDVKEIG